MPMFRHPSDGVEADTYSMKGEGVLLLTGSSS